MDAWLAQIDLGLCTAADSLWFRKNILLAHSNVVSFLLKTKKNCPKIIKNV
jgi:hypothetical protein